MLKVNPGLKLKNVDIKLMICNHRRFVKADKGQKKYRF